MSTTINIDKVGSATSPAHIRGKGVSMILSKRSASVGDVVAVRALSESVTYGNLELPSGRLAKINTGDVLLGVLGERRALKGFVGVVPATVAAGDRLHLLNMGGVIGECQGHHSSLSDAIAVEVLGTVCDSDGFAVNIQDKALAHSEVPLPSERDCRDLRSREVRSRESSPSEMRRDLPCSKCRAAPRRPTFSRRRLSNRHDAPA